MSQKPSNAPLHTPVLLEAVLKMAKEMPRPPSQIMDATFGRGGHTLALSQLFPDAKVVGVDCDLDAIAYGREHFAEQVQSGHWHLQHGNFSEIETWAGQLPGEFREGSVDLLLADLGVSSPQLDQAERGFSFYHQGPLDMRMDQSRPLTAAQIVNEYDAEDLMTLFREKGEIQRPGRVVSAIVERRETKPFSDTLDLSQLIAKVEGWFRKGHHPATRYFLALRMEVNGELERIESVLPQLVRWLAPGGRLMVITFHSLEDRIVKLGFKGLQDHGRIVNKKVIQASWAESKSNPRARSAKLRVFEKGEQLGETTGQ